MDKDMINKLIEPTDEEKVFIENSNTATTSDMNQSKIISDFYLIKQIRKITENTINSNEKIAKSNEEYANKMFWLSVALAVFAFVQILISIIDMMKN